MILAMQALPVERLGAVPAMFMDRVDSTNAEALRRIAADDIAGACWFVAKSQDRGRGRQGRPWHSLDGNVFASLAQPAGSDAMANAQHSYVAAIAVAESLHAFGVGEIACKWPNDVLVGDAKIAGILLEAAKNAAGQSWLVIGIGVNVAAAPPAQDTVWPATALAEHVPHPPSARAFLEDLAPRLALWSARLDRDGFAPLRSAWMQRAYGLGRRARMQRSDGLLEGLFLGIDETGGGRVRLDSGTERLVHAGELAFLREME
ncbi:MAG: biotin--[acetyl-CoA-carboxylase] ligase [Sphingomonadales bacterium]